MRIERASAEEVDRSRRCRLHPDTGHLVYEVTTGRVECTACLRGLPDDRPPQMSQAMVEDMRRLGIEVEE